MVARVARFTAQPERFTGGAYSWVLEAIKAADGFEAAYHFVDEQSGDSVSISLFASLEAARSAEREVGAARERLGHDSSPPSRVETWRLVDQVRR
jgi:hypothetical protein